MQSSSEEHDSEKHDSVKNDSEKHDKEQENESDQKSEKQDEKEEYEVDQKSEKSQKSTKEEYANGHILRRNSSIKRGSIYEDLKDTEVLFRPEFLVKKKLKDKNEKIWRLMESYLPREKISIQKSIVNHIEYTLARTRFDLDEYVLYQGTALSVRDRLLEKWNDSQMILNTEDPKRINYLSLEFLLGRLLQNSLINFNLEDKYQESLIELGYKLEDLYEKENDPALGNGGLGRLAACYLDSLTTLNFPAYGYGIRYDYGIFKQVIENFQQNELPDYWLTKGNPWEIMRLDVRYTVKFYGSCRDEFKHGKTVRKWEEGEDVLAIAFDTVVPGWNTLLCNTLRLWKSFPSQEFDFQSFNKGNYQSALEEKNNASYITSVLYPNDSTRGGKELRLKQQYFFCAATIQDIISSFLKTNRPWNEFPEKHAIQLNDTHPAVAITELLRILVDEYYLEPEEAFVIINKAFGYTNHTVLPEALEKWPVDLFGKLLPRHLELIYLLNHFFLEKVRLKYPKDFQKHSRMSIIEESCPKLIRMANLCIISSHTVNGVAELHTQLLKDNLFQDFNEFYPSKFINITNGATPRRWIHSSFRELSDILKDYYGNLDWLCELSLLENLPTYIEENNKFENFVERFSKAKLTAKIRVKDWVKENCKLDIDEHFLFDVQVKRIHEYKRQLMNCLYCVHRYLRIKEMTEQDREKHIVKRVTFFGGKAAPGYWVAKSIIKLINLVGFVVNNDTDVNNYFKVVFLPDYKVSLAQLIIPAADMSQHISTAGTEASGTSNMKFAMTGSLIIGTKDGANIEIGNEIGEDNIFFFGKDVNEVEKIRKAMKDGKETKLNQALHKTIDTVLSGRFGDISFIKDYLVNIMKGNDLYLIGNDFDSYIEAQNKVDECYKDKNLWYKKALTSISKMGYFSSDRSVQDYCDKVWKMKPVEVPKPCCEANKRIISAAALDKLEKGYLRCKSMDIH